MDGMRFPHITSEEEHKEMKAQMYTKYPSWHQICPEDILSLQLTFSYFNFARRHFSNEFTNAAIFRLYHPLSSLRQDLPI